MADEEIKFDDKKVAAQNSNNQKQDQINTELNDMLPPENISTIQRKRDMKTDTKGENDENK